MGQGSRAVKKMLLASGNRLYAKCVWCQVRVVWAQKLPLRHILNLRKDGNFPSPRVVYLLNKERHTDFVATVEHIKERSKGGTNYHTNLAISCPPCNIHRSNVRTHFYPECVQCGQSKQGNKKRCSRCNNENRERIMREKGIWDESRSIST